MRLIFGQQIQILCTNTVLLLVAALLFTACGKNDEPVLPEQQLTKNLTGSGNRLWRIKEIYVNTVPVTLTTSQRGYTKTYTISGFRETYTRSFSDSDGFRGTWQLNGTNKIIETITNNPGGDLELIINLLDANNMDVEYKKNGQTIRTVYIAY